MSTHEEEAEKPATTSDRSPLHFVDGKRRVDYVIVFQPPEDEISQFDERDHDELMRICVDQYPSRRPSVGSELSDDTVLTSEDERTRTWRSNFINGVTKNSIEVELSVGQAEGCQDYVFVKLHTPWSTLAEYAERLALRKPLAPEEVEIVQGFQGMKDQAQKTLTSAQKTLTSWFKWGKSAVYGNKNDEIVQLEKANSKKGKMMRLLNWKKPTLKKEKSYSETWIESLIPEEDVETPKDSSIPEEDDAKKPKTLVTSPFLRAHEDQFLIKDNDTFFSPAERSMITYHILTRIVFEESSDTKQFGIDSLKQKGAISAAYPLHSGEIYYMPNVKKLLYGTWAYFKSRFIHPDEGVKELDDLKGYFGEKIAFFFCWMAFYSNMLIPLAIAGLLIVICGAVGVSMDTSSYLNDICTDDRTMCPTGNCDKHGLAKYSKLNESTCTAAKLNFIFDNYAIIAYAALTLVWALVFMKLWRRRIAVLQTEWHVRDLKHKERLRPEFYNLKVEKRPNPVTNKLEPFISYKHKFKRRVYSMLATLAMIGVVCGVVVATHEFEIFLECHLDTSSKPITYSFVIAIASIEWLICVVVSLKVYTRICKTMTDYEMHRSESGWKNSFRFKYFLFSFINSNAVPMYYAVFVPLSTNNYDIMNGKGHYSSIHLSVYMIGEPIMLLAIEAIESKIKQLKKGISRADHEEEPEIHQGENDFILSSAPPHVLTEYYTETMIQYSFVTMYAAVFPMAACCAIIRNILRMHHLAYKYGKEWRRPIAERAQDIGIYFEFVKFISYFSIIVNAGILSTDTQLIPRIIYSYLDVAKTNTSFLDFRLKEHTGGDNITCWEDYRHVRDGDPTMYALWNQFVAVFFAAWFTVSVFTLASLINLVPNIPERENITILKEEHLAHKILQEYYIRGALKRGMSKEETDTKSTSQHETKDGSRVSLSQSRPLNFDNFKLENRSEKSSKHSSKKSTAKPQFLF